LTSDASLFASCLRGQAFAERASHSAKVVKINGANHLALLKAEGRFAALPVAASRAVKLGGTVATLQRKKFE